MQLEKNGIFIKKKREIYINGRVSNKVATDVHVLKALESPMKNTLKERKVLTERKNLCLHKTRTLQYT